MKPIAMLGLVLAVLGVAGLMYEGVSCTSRETVLDVGPIEATAERTRTIPISPIASGVAIVAGLGLIVVGQRKDR